ncbi:MAG: hypothetical protein OEV00_08600 [Acidobacteriota bacterium]|nr:hypothetical protein [Acidobacteriota bacterium]MDH3785369.1 hypothetical protein [Acidobacteriota bacterium]
MSPAPRLSNLQFLVLGTLLHGPRPGREIRDELHRFGAKPMREGWQRWLSVLGRLLPRRNREFIFEPALFGAIIVLRGSYGP